MADEPKIEESANEALARVQAVADKLTADAKSGEGWVKTHVAWVIGICCLIVGIVIGHAIK